MPHDPASSPILIVYAHPAPHLSRVNRRLAETAQDMEGVELFNLYDTYPDFFIDIDAEQARLERAAAVVFLHPIQWYSMPALLKEWIDVVFKSGWAYGKGGNALEGKPYWLVATAGSPEPAYAEGGLHARPFDAYLPAFIQTAALCGMPWVEPHILFGAHQVSQGEVDAHVASFTRRLRELRTNCLKG